MTLDSEVKTLEQFSNNPHILFWLIITRVSIIKSKKILHTIATSVGSSKLESSVASRGKAVVVHVHKLLIPYPNFLSTYKKSQLWLSTTTTKKKKRNKCIFIYIRLLPGEKWLKSVDWVINPKSFGSEWTKARENGSHECSDSVHTKSN